MTQRIVLTGGPCGGKTTALSRIPDRLRSLGWDCYLVPEVATIMLQSGFTFRDLGPSDLKHQQAELIRIQMKLEDSFAACVRTSKKSVLLCDRGLMDSAAYMPPDLFGEMLDANQWDRVMLRDYRYDGVIHLVTAAEGALPYYTTANNSVRLETPEEARDLDRKTREAWIGHRHLRVIGNESDFAGKIRRVEAAIYNILGEPVPMERERRFLVKSREGAIKWPVKYESIEIEQHYLLGAPGETERIRRRGQHGSWIYTHTIKRPRGHGQSEEIERQITPRDYAALLMRVDPSRHPISKFRICFLWEGRYFELDTFNSPRPKLEILEIEVDSLDEKIDLPPFIDLEREITGDPAWSNHALARG